jgi:hypothetical protein
MIVIKRIAIASLLASALALGIECGRLAVRWYEDPAGCGCCR